MTAQTWPWAGSHPSSGWPWLHNVSTSTTLAKGEDYRDIGLDWVLQPKAPPSGAKDEDPKPGISNVQISSLTSAETPGSLH
jgi:hypothetical protein